MKRYAVILHIPLSLMMCFALEWMSRHSFSEAWLFVTERTGAFLYNSYLIFVVYLLSFIGKKRTFWRMLISAVFVTLGIINCIILFNRVSPFGFSDIGMVGDLLTMQNTNYFSWGQAIVSASAILGYIIYLIILFKITKPDESILSLPVRLCIILLSFISVIPLTYGLRKTGVLTSYFGNLAQGYSDYGYIYGFATSALDRGMTRPLGYSEKTIRSILRKSNDDETTLDPGDAPNIVVVLLESYFDVDEANFIICDEDPMPFFHYLEDNYSTGHMTAPVVGAGTCNTEFEVLTGMTCQFFGPGEYPQKTVFKDIKNCESAASVLKPLGYSSTAVHNYGGDFYSRKNAFSKMGFDRFICEETLDITDYTPMGSWPTDGILIQPTLDAMAATDGPDFVYTITVGTHGDYPGYEVIKDPAIGVITKGKTTAANYQWLYYINMLHNMDNWMQDYIMALNSTGEDTLVIMFGDHLPTIGHREREVKTRDLYQTKYVTWNNFGMKKKDADLYAYQVVAEYMDRLGIHEGNFFKYNQAKIAAGVKAGSDRYIYDLGTLQYDLLYGRRYLYGDGDPYPSTDIAMGMYDISIDRTYRFADRLYIYGDGFTRWSKVFVNDEKVDTTYMSGQVLSIDEKDIHDGDTIQVGHVGDSFMDNSSSVFQRSNSFMVTLPKNTVIAGGEYK
ncbi:MAG: LTA synthase family protein [Lachnospiraceae bacterium]|nr:LTA synthase family protein [Lachnospiraceae bacterium]